MGRGTNKLSVKFTQRRDLEPGLYGDGGGLYLQVSAFDTKAWVYRFMMAGRARKMGLGDFDMISLADAREAARDAYKLVKTGVDPIDERKAKRAVDALAKARVVPFKECAEKYIASNKSGWKSAKHQKQWEKTLEDYVYPAMGHLPVSAIDTGLVLKAVESIWTEKTETANRVRGRIEQVLDWAKARGYRSGDNPARWRGHLDKILPARSSVAPVEHHAALPYAKLPGFMGLLRKVEGVSAKALQFTILTAARTGDAIGAKWGEIDLKEKVWTVPAARLKGKKGARKRDHVVPLSDAALTVLKDLPREGDFVFPGRKANTCLSNMAMLEVLRDMKEGDGLTVHGFRSTFKDWCSEQTAYPNEMSELALAHTVSDRVEAAYRRGDMLAKRRRMMADWASYCAKKVGGGDNIVPLKAKR